MLMLGAFREPQKVFSSSPTIKIFPMATQSCPPRRALSIGVPRFPGLQAPQPVKGRLLSRSNGGSGAKEGLWIVSSTMAKGP